MSAAVFLPVMMMPVVTRVISAVRPVRHDDAIERTEVVESWTSPLKAAMSAGLTGRGGDEASPGALMRTPPAARWAAGR